MPRSLLWPDPRVKPPFGAAEIDWGHPLAQGLIGSFLCNEQGGNPINGADGLPLVGVGTRSYLTTADGPAVQSLAGGSANGWDSADSTTYLAPTLLTVVARVIPSSTTASSIVSRGSLPYSYYLGWDLVSGSRFGFYLDMVAGDAWLYGTSSVVLGSPATVSGVWDGTTKSFYVNGRLEATATPTGPISYGSHHFHLCGRADHGLGEDLRGTLVYASVYDRAVLAHEHLQLHYEPYAMLRPIVRRRYFVPADAAAGWEQLLSHRRNRLVLT